MPIIAFLRAQALVYIQTKPGDFFFWIQQNLQFIWITLIVHDCWMHNLNF